jgi:GrpB-like predicted nucleotidyltransferase (UPF0157 family)
MATLVEIVPYDSNWPQQFTAIKAKLKELLGSRAASIEHIGSTAVPGLPAKPFIDIDIVLPDAAVMDTCRKLLENAGYEPRGSSYGDGVWAFMIRNPLPGQRVYLCPHDSVTHKKRMIFRDILRSSSDIAAAYTLLKKELAKRHTHDGDAYTAAKKEFICKAAEGILHFYDAGTSRLDPPR